MDRRTLLKVLAAATLAACDTRGGPTAPLRIVVAGAGIIGASIAFHLAKAGAAVTIIDKERPASHASRGTFAWINATWAKQPRSYHAFSQASVAYWHELHQALDLPVRWGGSLEWFDDAARQATLATQIAEQVSWGEPARMVSTPELTVLEPGVRIESPASAAYSPNDGAADPVVTTQKLLAAAVALGASLNYPTELVDVALSNGRLVSVLTSAGPIPADRLVLATGAAVDLPERIAGINVPQRSTPGVIAITAPAPRLLQHVIAAPGIHMHQRDDGRIVLGEQDGAPQDEAHALRLQERPDDFPDPAIAAQHAARMLAGAENILPAIAGVKIEHVYIGWRPLPIDGHPVIGASAERPDIYVAVMHSGVTLAPIVGRLAAQELTTGVAADRLSDYRPDRVFEDIRRY
ncbi:MAG: FAD-binding oxidoreductase [Gammaproteobacteria bacterium]|nr:FAD-binding oxidoreductase [Gammaproteobacteria bacterium]MDH5305032.1 FAD-binding oxidoreductase [Gammaproteobacteria bacterium]MDH5322964.1 FAD-binding oxidoreductase [Gammaproteobacteria bacterium]